MESPIILDHGGVTTDGPKGAGARGLNVNTYDAGESWKENVRANDLDFKTLPDGSRPDWFWTGPIPTEGFAGIKDGRISSLPMPNLASSSKEDVLEYFDNTWLITEVIFSGLQGVEAYYRPPYHNLRHPMIFYYGHPAALYVNKLRVAGLVKEPVNAYYEHIFETGVDEMAWDDLSKNDMVWPMVKEVTEYRRQVYNLVRNVLEESPVVGVQAIGWEDPQWALFMGFEHERIHIETSTVLLRELPLEYLQEPKWWPKMHEEQSARCAPGNPLVGHGGAHVVVGKPRNWPTYGWDNEYGRRNLTVPEFEATKYQITNGEFAEFVRDGGYRDDSLWTPEGWRWRTFRNAKWPPFWVPHGPAGLHQYKIRTIFRIMDFAAAAPVVVNAHEARAFAAWRTRKDTLPPNTPPSGSPSHSHSPSTATDSPPLPAPPPFRLLSEGEHHVLRGFPAPPPVDTPVEALVATKAGVASADPFPGVSGAALRAAAAVNLQMAYGCEAPVDAFGSAQAFGNAWSWCEDWFAALPEGHGVHPHYDDFSSPCYDGEHAIIMGGSFMSTGGEASRFARFHFRPHFHQHASFYLARSRVQPPLTHVDSPPPHVGSWNPSSAPTVAAAGTGNSAAARAALLHYDGAREALRSSAAGIAAAVPNFPSAIAFLVEGAIGKAQSKAGAVLDIGCGVGGVTFKLAEAFSKVVAIDRDSQLLSVAQELQARGSTTIQGVRVSGGVHVDVEVALPVSVEAAARATFRQMDPCCIAPDIGQFDAVVLNDILDKLISPKAPLGRMGGVSPIVKPGGVVVVVSAFDWDPTVTDRRLWLTCDPPHGDSDSPAGQLRSGSAKASIQKVLGDDFSFLSESSVPCLAMDHARKFTLKVMHVLAWKHCVTCE